MVISLHRDPQDPNILVVETPYNKQVLSELKGLVPYTDRTWDPKNKVWLVSASWGKIVANILKREWPDFIPDIDIHEKVSQKTEDRIIKLEYIGVTKERENGEETAFGYVDGEWSYIFPKNILEGFFTGFTSNSTSPPKKSTLYTTLQIDQTATEDEIKQAYWRMAKIWHPDINQEPNANEMFLDIKRAYEMLSDTSTRAKYDFGLRVEAQVSDYDKNKHDDWLQRSAQYGYRSPLTCGMLHVTVKPGARNVVTDIHKWKDIINDKGQILVTSWKKGADMFNKNWV